MSPMPAVPDTDEHLATGPAGRSVEAHAPGGENAAEERAELERLAAFEELARLVIVRRAQLGYSQAELARRMNRPRSVVSRIESGQHPTNTATLKRLGEALGGHAIIGFDFGQQPAATDVVRL